MMARVLAHGIVVDRVERGEIARGQGSGPRPPREIAGELRPVSRLQRQILAGRDNSAFGESGARDRHILRQNLRRFSKDRQRQMMLAQRWEEKPSELNSLWRIS